jgi:hypothetical protein
MSFKAHAVLDTSCFMFVAENFKGDVGMSRARKMTAYNVVTPRPEALFIEQLRATNDEH